MSVKSKEHCGHPSVTRSDELVHHVCDRRLCSRIFYCLCQTILIENLEMRHAAVKLLPHVLTDEQNKSACLWLLIWLNMQRPVTVY
jgi:hypothetical protein